MRGTSDTAGFTIVEMIVTVVLAGIFLLFFIQMYRATNAQQASLIRQSIANDIARSNLAKFPTAATITDYTCDATENTNNPNNLQFNPDARGENILTSDISEEAPDNIGEVEQFVYARSPLGCGDNKPIQITSSVTYGFAGQRNTVEYSTYVF